MVYASSKLALRQSLPGFLTDIQGTDLSEVSTEAGAWLFLYSALSCRIDFVFYGSQCWRKSRAVKGAGCLARFASCHRSIHIPPPRLWLRMCLVSGPVPVLSFQPE